MDLYQETFGRPKSTMATADAANSVPTKVVIAAGTYDGVLAGWELNDEKKFHLSFASPVHGGSVRSLAIAQPTTGQNSPTHPGGLLSCGYDEMLKIHDFAKRLVSSGEVRTPADLGTPVCCSFAPPLDLASTAASLPSTHGVVGFSSGKLVIYKKRDWSVQHILAGHEGAGGVSSLAVHPSGKLALTGGASDGKLKLWDLTKGRLAYVSKIAPASTTVQGRTHYDPIVSIVWSLPLENQSSSIGEAYAFCYGTHVTVRDVGTGKDVLDVELPSRVNEVCLLRGAEGLFVAAACNDGSLPVLAVQGVDSKGERRAIMAIEPVEGPIAGEERFKCIKAVGGYHVATANSAGVVSLMNLRGAVNMILRDGDGESEETPVHPESDDDDDGVAKEDDNDDDVELAVDMIDSIQLGTGARITCLVAWSSCNPPDTSDRMTASNISDVKEVPTANEDALPTAKEDALEATVETTNDSPSKQLKRKRGVKEVVMGADALEKARDLVSKAKKLQKRKERKKQKHRQGDI